MYISKWWRRSATKRHFLYKLYEFVIVLLVILFQYFFYGTKLLNSVTVLLIHVFSIGFCNQVEVIILNHAANYDQRRRLAQHRGFLNIFLKYYSV